MAFRTIQSLANDGGCRAIIPYEIRCKLLSRDTDIEDRTPSLALTLKEAEIRFQTLKSEFEASTDFRRLRSVMMSTTIPLGIQKIVAFACGSPSAAPRPASFLQHILILSLKDILSSVTGAEIQCFAQDPIYSAIDKQLLCQHGISVVVHPQGFLHVDNSSIVISIAPNIPVKQIITELARPAVIIWDRISGDPKHSTDKW